MPKISTQPTRLVTINDTDGSLSIPSLNIDLPSYDDGSFFVNRSDPIAQNIALWGSKPAIIRGTDIITFGELDDQADRVAKLLLLAAAGSSRFMAAIFTQVNFPFFFSIALACRRSGLSYTNFVNTIEAKKITEQLAEYPYRLLFADEPMLYKLDDHLVDIMQMGIAIVGIDTHRKQVPNLTHLIGELKRPRASIPDDIPKKYSGPVLYTSGTVKEAQRISVRPGHTTGTSANRFFQVGLTDKHLVIGKLYHGAALSWSQGHLRRGATIVLGDNSGFKFFPNKILRIIETEQITTLWICPAWLQLLSEAKLKNPERYNSSSLRNIYVSAAPFNKQLKLLAMKAFGSIFYDNYATTETGSISILKPDEMESHVESVGKVLPHVTVNIRDDDGLNLQPGQIGRIFARSPMTDPDYINTGDDGFIDTDGYLHVVGRTCERIIVNGHKIYPRLLEALIASDDGVRESHVVWNPDDPQRISIFLLPRYGTTIDLDSLANLLSDEYKFGPDFKIDFYQLNNLPRKPYKIDHQKLSHIVKRYQAALQDLKKLEAVLGNTQDAPDSSKDIVAYLEEIPWLSEHWDQIASPQFQLTLKEHTLRVLNQYNTYFLHEKYRSIIDPRIMRLILSVHDLGKPIAVKEKNTNKEHIETTLLVQRTFVHLGINPIITELACSLISFVFGHYIRGVRLIQRMKMAIDQGKTALIEKFKEVVETDYNLTPDDAKLIIGNISLTGESSHFLIHLKNSLIERIKERAQKLGISTISFFELLTVYHRCDASTYTTKSHVKHGLDIVGKLDDLFVIDDDHLTIEYAEPVNAFVDDVRITLSASTSEQKGSAEILNPLFSPAPLGLFMSPSFLSR